MATTRIIPLHVNKGKTIAQCLTERTDYASNPEKTQKGELVTSYACDPHTVDAEFLLSKKEYAKRTGRDESMLSAHKSIIAYQVRQSFKPGEVTPEEANQIGYEFASRFLKGKHAFIVATHTDRKHIHNHIIWNSTALDCSRKFNNFFRSSDAVRKLSDMVCAEHLLSVIQEPSPHGLAYNKWLGNNAKVSHRDVLRQDIDTVLRDAPMTFDTFLRRMEALGYSVKIGAHVTFSRSDFSQSIRLRSLGEGYSEDEIRAVLAGTKEHMPHKKYTVQPKKTNLLIDIQKKLTEGKGSGYKQWATVFNLKQMAKTLLYLQENGLTDYAELVERSDHTADRIKALKSEIKEAKQRMAENKVLQTHITNYSKTRDVYVGYRKAGYSKKYLAEHESDISIHKAAKDAFDELGIKKLPSVKSLKAEYAELMAQEKAAYAEYHALREQQRELLVHKANVEQILEIDRDSEQKNVHSQYRSVE